MIQMHERKSVKAFLIFDHSLENIYKELAEDIEGFSHPGHGDLTGWAKQGEAGSKFVGRFPPCGGWASPSCYHVCWFHLLDIQIASFQQPVVVLAAVDGEFLSAHPRF